MAHKKVDHFILSPTRCMLKIPITYLQNLKHFATITTASCFQNCPTARARIYINLHGGLFFLHHSVQSDNSCSERQNKTQHAFSRVLIMPT